MLIRIVLFLLLPFMAAAQGTAITHPVGTGPQVYDNQFQWAADDAAIGAGDHTILYLEADSTVVSPTIEVLTNLSEDYK